MEAALALIDRFRVPITVVLVTAIIAGTGLLAFRSLELRTLVSKTANSVTSNDEIASLKSTQSQLEQQLASLKAQADALPVSTAEAANSTTTNVPSTTNSDSGSTGVVHLNSADLAALDTLTGIGPTKAQAILDYRTAHGSFKSIDDLLNVKGIGDATLAKIRSQLTLD